MTGPSGAHVAIGVVVSLLGCLGCAAAVEAARRTGNRLWWICAVGTAALVAGIVGQHAVDDQAGVQPGTTGPWDASINLPALNIHVTPVALGGFVTAVAGLSLVLFFEPVIPPPRPAVRVRPLEDDDTV